MCCKFSLTITPFLQNIRKQKLGILFIALITTSICAWYASKLPNVYESKAILEIKLVDNYFPLQKSRKKSLNRRLIEVFDRDVLNDSSLENLIDNRYLFGYERASGTSIETIKNRVRNNLVVEGGNRRTFDTVVFSLKYRDADPQNARLVLSALTEKLTNSYWGSTDEDLLTQRVFSGVMNFTDREQSIKVLSPPNEPYKPVAPKRFRIVAFGMFSGLFLGLFLATIYGLPEIYRGKPV